MARPVGPDTKQQVGALIAEGRSGREIARILGVSPSTVSYHRRTLGHPPDERCNRRYDWAEVQAFHDSGHTARECFLKFGMSPKTWHDARIRGDLITRPAAKPIEELLAGAAAGSRGHIKRRLIEAGLKPQHCEGDGCGLGKWRGQPLSLQLHHINGDKHDNRLENLELLCPNCHSQTENWGGRNARRRSDPPGVV